ncbi:isocitrate lyase/PEP mutase family protein [Bradyrhizobium sp. Ai1a-2]|uniref:isocitrate lyase/PEP mutase family protein n=1 Tax=Bradyrhizobium sp. Ai1a-2 TaxID=196490 RepID=UPI00040B7EDC|nr:isocitrate lyase/PEP mutase family protein [Bradyrhizobium sp. Ai1a-2]
MTSLRQLLNTEQLVVAPGVYDGLTVRLVEQAGFQAAYMTGAGTAAAHGFPDYGIVTATEMVETAGIIACATKLPVIADADTGYGNELNVTRTVRDFEMRGVSAIHIEDQVAPKRCGHLDGKQVISAEEFVSKIGAAVRARRNPDFMIIARTDSRAVADLDEAISRANAALAVGADMAFVEAVRSKEELAAVTARVDGPCILNVVPGGKTPPVTFVEAKAMGYRLAILPGALLQAIVPAIDAALRRLVQTGLPEPFAPTIEIAQAFRRFGASEWDALRSSFAGKSV